MSNKLAFGYPPPEGVTAAWGARLIVTQHGMTDLVYNRQDAYGEWDDLKAWLDPPSGVLRKALDVLSEKLKSYQVKTREAEEVTLYLDDKGIVKGNSNGSAGYFYVCAYLFQDAPVIA